MSLDSAEVDLSMQQKTKTGRLHLFARCLSAALLVTAALVAAWWLTRARPSLPVEIYQGVTYGCRWVEDGEHGAGWAHWLRIDLDAPGVELFMTPTEPVPEHRLARYRLRHGPSVLRENNLAAVVNGALFSQDAARIILPGTPAYHGETIVSDGQLNHIHPHSYLMWFDDQLNPQLEFKKPPTRETARKAKWGISGQQVVVYEGKVRTTQAVPNRRTIIAVNPQHKQLWLAVFDHASYSLASRFVVTLGATQATMLDGGSSTTMVIADDARGAPHGTLLGGWRPVATYVGIRARPLQ
jgi:hypothetical protein